ncbi:hypothetical protein BpOF4_17990 [Alkalihalophilus pseudofirmus OF4]|uniref:Uncharacterized protein n=1 Tax=Alkalihalophilus pseudofirmus (strain ATCC BAA-2126 / JCM 17055 / OF4) TaxID=398511 RepID=D3FS04_ALKPO|nr:hypothetical protein BpOF4_17990 [Alkalihalophilus pseudofirmus OF4]
MRKQFIKSLPPLIEAEGARLLRDVHGQGDPTGRKPEEAPGPPAESEYLQRRSTTNVGAS